MTDSPLFFLNLPVTDLARAEAFYEALGGTKEPRFSNDAATMMRLSDVLHVMLLTHDFYRGFTPRPIADPHAASAALFCLSAPSKTDVDAVVDRTAAAGGTADIGPRQEHGDLMYGRSVADPDGHHWEIMWMDAATADTGASALEQA